MTASTKPNVVFFLGGPGSGKGTISEKLVQNFGFHHLSAGDLLRAEQSSGSEHGEMIKELIKEGKIVPSIVTVDLLEKAMKASNKTNFLIDGFPRNEENNSSWVKAMDHKVDFKFVLHFDCPEDILLERLLNRGKTSGRSDDNVESIKKRFKTFEESTIPVVKGYEDQGKCVRIDSSPPVEDVWQKVRKVFLEKGFKEQ